MDSAGYVVSRLHEINKMATQRLAGVMPPQHRAGKAASAHVPHLPEHVKATLAVPCPKQSALMRDSMYLLSSTLQWPCHLAWSTGEASSCLHGERVHQASICLQNEMQKYIQVFCLTLLSGTDENMRRGIGGKKGKLTMGNEWRKSCPKAVLKHKLSGIH